MYCSKECAWKAAEDRPPASYNRNGLPVWDAGRVAALTGLWYDGLSAAAIGRQLGFSKNAVIGKARRLGLAGRDSPLPVNGTHEGSWTPEMEIKLRDLWANSRKNASAIGREIGGFSGGAVSHKARRMALGPRGWTTWELRAKTMPRRIFREVRLAEMLEVATLFDNPEEPEERPAPVRRAPEPLPPTPVYYPHKTCQFFVGSNRRTWKQCDAPTRPGSPYCEEHHRVCYIPRKRPVEMEAA